MSRGTKKSFEDKVREIEEKETDNTEEFNSIMDRVISGMSEELYEEGELDPNDPDDLMEMAFIADSDADRLKYARKALRLDPRNIEAKLMVIRSYAIDKQVTELQKAIKLEKQRLEDEGYVEKKDIGNYESLPEAELLLIAMDELMIVLDELNKKRLAIEVGEEIIRLSGSDDIQIRYRLMRLYAEMEEIEKMDILYRQHGRESSPFMLFPLAIAHYKMNSLTKAKRYIDSIYQSNKHFIKLIKGTLDFEKASIRNDIVSGTCGKGSECEMALLFMRAQELFVLNPHFIDWAISHLDAKLNPKKRKK